MGPRVRTLLASLAAVLVLGVLVPAAASGQEQETVDERGYLEMADGTELQYLVRRPAGPGPFAVVLNYSGYAPGHVLDSSSVLNDRDLLAAGYALVGVNVRGSGCSGGTFELFEEQWAADGYEVVEWAGTQPWSNGRVALHGTSLPGITQFQVAGTRPPHLSAILPNSTIGDLYRDVAYPGGMQNVTFSNFFVAVQNANSADVLESAVLAGDATCVQNFAAHTAQNPADNVLLLQTQNRYDGDFYRSHSPGEALDRIEVPALLFNQWQDEQLPARVPREFGRLDPSRTWFVGGNGNHAFPVCPRCQEYAYDFLDWALRDVDNGWPDTPHFQLWQENDRDTLDPAWVVEVPSWPPVTDDLVLHLRSDGLLSRHEAGADEPSSTYAYPLPAASVEPPDGTGGGNGWKQPVPPGGAVSWTTPPLDEDLVLYGAALDLWLSSTSTDTDLQVTLTEVRPDGMEEYVQRGWLRASHRVLDTARSTTTRPHHTHLESDVAPLVPGEPTRMQIGLFDVSDTVRAGSSLRITVEAPVGLTGYWQLGVEPGPATNTVLHDAAHPSRLVVGRLGGEQARTALPACDSLVNQPCRANATPVPAADRPTNAGDDAPQGGPGDRSEDPAPASPDAGDPVAAPGSGATGPLPVTGAGAASLALAVALLSGRARRRP